MRWQLLTDIPSERATFADLATTLQQPRCPAGPANRARLAERLETPVGVFYLKTFRGLQWQNRVRFLLTAPRAADDAERELRVTAALRAAGHAAPRPVAYGRVGATAYYLCAELPGRSMATLLATGGLPTATSDRIANHLGRLLQQGFDLPDLAPDHVFVDGDGAAATFGLLDLHNGALRPAGSARSRTLVRVLRRFSRAVRGTGLPLRLALRFALRLLTAAGQRTAARAILRRLPPWPSQYRYEAAGKNIAYAERNPRRAARETRLLRAVWPGRAAETVLDMPCGTGRLLPLLRDELGHRVLGADGALAMLRLLRAQPLAAPAVQADALAMPFQDGTCDGVVMFRFLHHLPPDAQKRAIHEACRVARRFVVVSFFHPCSAHHLQRLVRSALGKTPTRFATSSQALLRTFADNGFVRVDRRADLPYLRDLWVAAFVRTSNRG